jgi:hypothetical protein
MTSSEQGPTVYNDQPDPQFLKFDSNCIGTKCEKGPPLSNGHFFLVPGVVVVHGFDCTCIFTNFKYKKLLG